MEDLEPAFDERKVTYDSHGDKCALSNFQLIHSKYLEEKSSDGRFRKSLFDAFKISRADLIYLSFIAGKSRKMWFGA